MESKETKVFRFALPAALLFMPFGKASAIDPDLGRFATAKEAQVREYSQGLTNKVPSIVWGLFDAVRVDDWETATNLAARIDKASGRYTNSATDQTMSPALLTVIWAPISEMIGHICARQAKSPIACCPTPNTTRW